MKNIIEFQGEFRWLSNFVPVRIELDGRVFPSVEHAYMSAKSEDASWKELCADADIPPGHIKRRSRSISLRPDWEMVKLEVMETCLRQKFAQEPFRSKLLATADAHIQEGNMWHDKFWGVCLRTGKGENNLGKLIMKIREELK